MSESSVTTYTNIHMSNQLFQKFSDFIQSEFGIKMPPIKKTMLETRLQKRLRKLELTSFSDYYDFVFSEAGAEELIHMIDVVTTNKTDFFREPNHFDFLVKEALPDIIQRNGGFSKIFHFWSAGCSTGEEPYTLAMVLSEFAARNSQFKFRIFATDICVEVLNNASAGIYKEDLIKPIPLYLRKKYLLKSKNQDQKMVRIIPHLRNLIDFQRLNLMDDDFDLHQKFDAIFCRNVIIYFGREDQQELLIKFYNQMHFNGYLFMGHSETLAGLNVPFSPIAPTVYQKITS